MVEPNNSKMKECIVNSYKNRFFIYKKHKTIYAKENGVMYRYIDKTEDYSFLSKYFEQKEINPQTF